MSNVANPIGLEGIEFVEFTGADKEMWHDILHEKHEEGLLTPDDCIKASHQRCDKLGLQCSASQCAYGLEGTALSGFLSMYEPLKRYAHLLFSETQAVLPDKNQIIVLTDKEGYIIEMFYTSLILEIAARETGLRCGAAVCENSCGTNAVALALIHRKPAVLRGSQHYLNIFSDWFCAAAPVFSPSGNLCGCISISSHRDSEIGEKLALVSSVSRELGRFYPDPILKTSGQSSNLTPRQQEVLTLYASGFTYKEMARKIGLSPRTIQEHLDTVRTKLSVTNRRGCIQKALELGLLL